MAKFEKGHKKIPGSGMQKGMKSYKTKAWDALGEFLTGDGSQKSIDILTTMKGKEFIDSFERLIEFFKPKLQRTDFQGEIDHKFNELNYNGSYLPSDVK